ncbi:MAG: DUF429 domain-containing protein [Actinomycetes bacterium]
MSTSLRRRGNQLPYDLLAGVVSCPGGWLVCPGKLVGVNLFADAAYKVGSLRDVLDSVPQYAVIALAAPVGLPDRATHGGRACDREARRLLGWPRAGGVRSAPCRDVLHASHGMKARAGNDARMDAVTTMLLPRIREVADEIQSYWQRTVFEAHPELSFYQLNDDRPLASSKRSTEGVAERRSLLVRRLPGVESALDANVAGVAPWHLLDAAAVLWTARRIAARAVVRLPEAPEWNKDGLRMEILR